MLKPPPSGPHSDIDGLRRSALEGDENRQKYTGSAKEQVQDHSKSKAKPPQNEQGPGGHE